MYDINRNAIPNSCLQIVLHYTSCHVKGNSISHHHAGNITRNGKRISSDIVVIPEISTLK